MSHRFCKYISDLTLCCHVGKGNNAIKKHVPNKVTIHFDMFCTLTEYRI